MTSNPKGVRLEDRNAVFELRPEIQVARIWSYRERIEHEAADMFAQMSDDLTKVQGRDTVTQMAETAARDEKRHAVRCRAIIDELAPTLKMSPPQLGIPLGPTSLTLRTRALYACVAASCITETLSTALLVEMKKWAEPKIIRETVHEILEDEISHSRLGWAQLAQEAQQVNVSWLAPYVGEMINAALLTDVKPMVNHASDLRRWGILPAPLAREVMATTLKTVILPGLAQFGIHVGNIEPTIRQLRASS